MTYKRKRPSPDPCPVESVFKIVAGKWKVRVLYLLSLEDLTFSELRNSIGGIRQQVLSTVLRSLIVDGAVWHAATASSERSTYGLTTRGRELIALLTPLAEWGNGLLAEQGTGWDRPTPRRNAHVDQRAPRP
jgi:DNA-binding HxlR family transcriptional regulator